MDVEVKFRVFYILILDEAEYQLHSPANWPTRKEPWYTLNRSYGGSQDQSGRGYEEENLCRKSKLGRPVWILEQREVEKKNSLE
jgi:hypothetical protein